MKTKNVLAMFGMAVLGAVLVLTPQGVAQDSQTQNDAAVEAGVMNAIGASATLRHQSITATTEQGEVTLSGNVPDEATRELAEAVAGRVNGVRSVVNQITVGAQAASAQPTQAADDQQPQQYPQQYPNGDNSQVAAAPQPEMQSAEPVQAEGQMQEPQVDPNTPQFHHRAPYQRAPYDSPAQAVSGPVTIPQGTLLRVRTSEPVDSKQAQVGTMVQFTAAADVYSGGALAIPRGAVLEGQIVDLQKSKSGDLKGSNSISLKLTSLILEGRTYALDTDVFVANGPGKGGQTASGTVGGAALGAIIGGIAGNGPGAAIGAVTGGALGTAAGAAASGPRVVLPPETALNFHLVNAVTVQPVSSQEAQRLASAQQQPSPRPYLRRRPYPYGYSYPYPYPGPVVYAPYPYRYYRY